MIKNIVQKKKKLFDFVIGTYSGRKNIKEERNKKDSSKSKYIKKGEGKYREKRRNEIFRGEYHPIRSSASMRTTELPRTTKVPIGIFSLFFVISMASSITIFIKGSNPRSTP